jgi:ADP-heptose:LPS heptosyltransferase
MNLRVKQWLDKYPGGMLVILHVWLVRMLGVLLKRNHTLQREPETILIIKILGLGSVLMAADALSSLKKRYPNAKLVLLTSVKVAPGIAPLKLFDDIWQIDDRSMGRMLITSARNLLRCWKMRRMWVVDLEVYSALTTLFSAWTMAINRFGFELSKVQFRHYINTHHVYFNQFIPVALNYSELVKAAGVENISIFKPPYIHQSTKRDVVVINNTCSELGGHLRKLTDSQLKSLCTLLTQSGYRIILAGAPSDMSKLDLFIQTHFATSESVSHIAGKLTFYEYYHFLSHSCTAMISIDSAPLHIALMLGVPVVSLWGPINPVQRIQPDKSKRHLSYYLGKSCSPCIHLTEHIPCNGNNHCMKDMQIATIASLLHTLIYENV